MLTLSLGALVKPFFKVLAYPRSCEKDIVSYKLQFYIPSSSLLGTQEIENSMVRYRMLWCIKRELLTFTDGYYQTLTSAGEEIFPLPILDSQLGPQFR